MSTKTTAEETNDVREIATRTRHATADCIQQLNLCRMMCARWRKRWTPALNRRRSQGGRTRIGVMESGPSAFRYDLKNKTAADVFGLFICERRQRGSLLFITTRERKYGRPHFSNGYQSRFERLLRQDVDLYTPDEHCCVPIEGGPLDFE